MSLTPSEIQFINEAQAFLENPSFLVKAANLVGKPLEKGLKMLPASVQTKVHGAVEVSIKRGLEIVSKSVVQEAQSFEQAIAVSRKQGWFHTAASFATGVVGGFFGVASLPVELPVTTAIMLRSIVSTARDFGHDISTPDVQLECLYVLSLGSSGDKAVQSVYWTSRLAFSDIIRHAAREIEKNSGPLLLRFLAQVASRYELVVSEKALAELVPVVGAIGGGAINAAFSEHFNTAARFHFGLRALEKKYGEDVVQAAYLQA
jgi:hypothetical protein